MVGQADLGTVVSQFEVIQVAELIDHRLVPGAFKGAEGGAGLHGVSDDAGVVAAEEGLA